MTATNNQGGQGGEGGQGNQGGEQGQGGQGGDNQSYINHPDNPNADPNWRPAVTGGVVDPDNDGRLKENREAGVTKGTTEHSSKAPFVDKGDGEGGVNAGSDKPAQEQYRGDGRGYGAGQGGQGSGNG